ncbi:MULTISPECIES: penicillin acylase family protein [unclassified Rhizobacter]|uniref:penicillin acylase family protein n=1 Tax=unclassified Rhizobacter TaxID=2640088 RepID=UPI0006FAE578|nr:MULTISPECIES: penicillin acylase family protein [unclassified Rhizobacter]KQU64412.1 penicillin amidase [Rhizobacter sp. Root29]KQW11465.1 penicillin amidase [Rhizobacter sp. Root1238]KRB19723.1 penicillin amidase [Rhizobacter sp. Root16D2]
MTWLKRGALGLAIALGLAAALLWAYARSTLPQVDGEQRVEGLRAEVRIERDAQGVPTIHAASREDAMFGLGFAHAQDRLWQIETHRRIGAGQLAEAFGEPALDTDRFLRALGVRRAAQAQWQRASPATRYALEAYSAGINAYLAGSLKARPPEFVLLGLQPQRWTPVDSLAWATMMAWDLGGNWSTELLRMRLSLKMPVERINELLPPYPGEKPLSTADYAALFRGLKVDGTLGRQALLTAPESGVEGVGSNNWVVAGSHTDSGLPLLANDPHLKLSAPSLWYLARLDAPGFQVAGATMPGLPIVVLGQSDRIAWGFTNTAPDVQDLYLERIRPDDDTQYQTPDGWAAFERSTEVIKVKGHADVTMTVRSTRHGPVISDAGGPTEGLTGAPNAPTYALAMRWTALDPDADSVDAGIGFNAARSVDEFIAASAGYVAPMQSMVVADVQGRIAMVAAGRVPVRGPAHDLKGLVPAPGWDARYDWIGSVPAGETPREVDPARGWIATANQRIVGPDYPHFLTSEWAVPYRHQRIEQLLAATPKHSIASLRTIQRDQLSLAALKLLPVLKRAVSTHPLATAAQRELASFDGTMAADRAAPLILSAWIRQLTQAVFSDELGAALYERQLGSRSFREALEGVLERQDGWWCDDKTTPAVETCAQQVDAAFTRTLDELQQSQGAEVSAWQWGRAHQARAEHRPFSKVKALARWFELRAPVGGDTYTVNVSRVGLRPDATTGELYLDDHGPSLRALYDLGDKGRSRFMQSSGQSGIVFSPLYRNWVDRWARVEDVPVWGGVAEHTLVLQPQP